MNLRTDDIQGARPRIRHAPKNLIHERKLYQNQQFNIYPQQKQNSYLNQLNLSESFHEKSPALKNQYRSDPRSDMYEKYQENYRQGNDQFNRYERQHQQRQTRREQQPQYINSKQMQLERPNMYDRPRKNYQQSVNPEKQHHQPYSRSNSREKGEYSRDQIQDYLDYKKQKQYHEYLQNQHKAIQKPTMNAPSQRSRSRQQNSQSQPTISQPQKPANIFRGLGFNIITNTKFSYDMENNLKNTTSKWI